MPRDEEIKIVPARAVEKQETKETGTNYAPWLIALIAVYFVLMLLISFLPLTGYLKVLSLILGAFLVFDILHSVKWYIRNINGK